MKRLVLLFLALLAGFGLAACGSSAPTAGNPAPGDHNAADATFAQMMIPHHKQAVEMSGYAATRAGNAEVKQLAEQIRGAQDPEIKQMTGWLTSWKEPVDMPGMSGKDMGSMDMSSMPGMRSKDDMAKLAALSGTAFDRMFLTMMMGHHRGAIEMAATEKKDGRYGPAQQLAASITSAQAAEIDKMQQLLTQL